MNHPLVSTYADLMTSSVKLINRIATDVQTGRCSLTREDLEMLAITYKTFMEKHDFSRSNSEFDDALGRENGICADLASYVATIYQAQFARLGTAGSSAINNSVGTVMCRMLGHGFNVLIDGGAHLSMIGGLTEVDANVTLFHRRFDIDHGVQLPLTADDIESALRANPKTDVVIITSPVYDGGVSKDFKSIRSVCSNVGALLVVDSAWGAQFSAVTGFPESPAKYSDMTIVSLHKKGIGLSQTSVALFNNVELLEAYDDCANNGRATTSPAFYMLQALEAELFSMSSERGKEIHRKMLVSASLFSNAMDDLPGVSRVRFESLGSFESDPCHLLFDTRNTGLTGYEILEGLCSNARWDPEMATLTSVLILFGPDRIDSWPELVQKFKRILEETKRGDKPVTVLEPPLNAMQCEHVMTPHRAFFAGPGNIVRIPLKMAAGKVAAQSLAAYPPGAAIIIPGVRVSQAAIDYLLDVQKAGSRLKGELTKEGLAVMKNA